MLPRQLKNFNCYLDGTSYAGLASEVQLPELSVNTADYRGGGMDAPEAVDMGMEALSATVTLAEYNQQMLKAFGVIDHRAVNLQFRGAIQREGEDAVPVIAEMTGRFTAHNPNAWESGSNAPVAGTFRCSYYKLTVDGETIYEIDVENMKRIIGGEDQMASIRGAIGI